MRTQAERRIVGFLHIFLLWSVCQAQLGEISHPASFQAVKLGDTVTITCRISHSNDIRTRLWIKLNTARRLQMVASTDFMFNLTKFGEQSHHYFVKSDKTSSHLTITAATWGDVGTYYCGMMYLREIQFGSGTFLMIKGANMFSDSVVQQPESLSVQPGDSLTLSCSVRTGHCEAENTDVMWMKNSHHSTPQMIYSLYDKNHTCQRTESGETACVHNLLMRNLSSEDAGTFFCVVTSCGRTLFGNGSTINIHRDAAFTYSVSLSPAVIALMLSNIVFVVATLLLIRTLCKRNKRTNKKDPTASRSSDETFDSSQTGEAVIYTAVCPPRGSSFRPAPEKYNQDAVYSDIRVHQLD